MSTDFASLLVVSIALVVLICFWAISCVKRSPQTRYWPLDIRLLNSAFFLLLDFQFLFASQYKSFRIGEQTLNCSDSSLFNLQLGNLLFFCLYAGLMEVLISQRHVTYKRGEAAVRDGRTAYIMFTLVAASIYAFLVWQIGEIGFATFVQTVGARQYKNEAAFVILNASPFVLVASLYLIFKSRSLTPSLIAVFVFTTVAVLSGGRGNIVSAFLLLVCALLANGRPPNPYRMFVFGLVPLLIFLQLYTAYIRYAGFQGHAEQGIWFETLVESESFAVWKSIYAVNETGFELPYPFYGLSASLFFPVPRSLAPFKPEPPSSLFTKFVSPVRFENTGSEITLSGPGTLMAEFGSFAGAFVFTLMIALASAIQYRLSTSAARQIEAFVAYFYLFALWRSDLFTASRILWTFLIVTILFLLFRAAGFAQEAPIARRIRKNTS